jgi:hypothetical protein
VGSRSPAPNKKLLLQLLHQELGKGSRSSNQKGIFIASTFFYRLLLICKLPCRMLQDIPSASPTKNISSEHKSSKVGKPLSPSIGKIPARTLNPPGLEDINVPTGATSNPTSSPSTDLGCDTAHQSRRPDPAMHQDASPISQVIWTQGSWWSATK